jgi:hypothetical protein
MITNAYKMYWENVKGRGIAKYWWEDIIKWVLNK